MAVDPRITRVFYDRSTGNVLYQIMIDSTECVTDFAVLEITGDTIDYSKHYIYRIDKNGNPIFLTNNETEEQKRIRELEEDIKLIQADFMIGGIL